MWTTINTTRNARGLAANGQCGLLAALMDLFFKRRFSKCNSAYGGAPLVSQHSRSQALVKEEGCVRRGEPM